jgi:hypothetical protein
MWIRPSGSCFPKRVLDSGMKLRTILAAGALALLIVGCGDKKSAEEGTTGARSSTAVQGSFKEKPAPAGNIVGKWTPSKSPGQVMEFKSDGTGVAAGPLPGTKAKLTAMVAYKVDGDRFTLTLKDAKLEGADAALKKRMEPQIKSAKGKAQIATIKWNGPDEFTLTTSEGGITETYARKK